MAKITVLGLILVFSLAGFAVFGVFASRTQGDIAPIEWELKDEQALALLKPYRNWPRINKEPIEVDLKIAPRAG